MKKLSSALTFLLLITLMISPLHSSQRVNASTNTSTTGAVLGPKLTQLLSSTTEQLEVIVTFKNNLSQDEILSILANHEMTKGVVFKSLPIAGAFATSDMITSLASNENVYSIYYNESLQYDNEEATAITGVDAMRTDDKLRKENGGLPVTGKNIGVVINDSGVDGTHDDIKYGNHLVQNVLGSTNLHAIDSLLPITYIEDVPNTDNNSGHGTHVAGIVGGNGAKSGGKFEGTAPGANLIGYGSGLGVAMLDTIGGFDYALTHQSQYNIRVITNSWGATSDAGTPFDPYNPINVATKKLYDRGIVTIFSAGNSGPNESTISGNYKKAPWVITVAAGTKSGTLADFSSRGVSGKGGTVVVDGKEWTWEDRPTITAPGKDIVSTRVVSPITALGATDDVENLEPAYIPYYTTMSGTSMAAPQAAGVVALMLEANPLLSPLEVKSIIQRTATNMTGYEAWEVGAGYINAYEAVKQSFYGENSNTTANVYQTFNAKAEVETQRTSFSIEYDPTNESSNEMTFDVPEGQTELSARINAKGLLGETGNPVNLKLVSPDGTEYSSGISVLFSLYTNRTVQVVNPVPGTWKVVVEGLGGLAAPETINGELTFKRVLGYTGLNDIAGHPAQSEIQLAVKERLVDSFSSKDFKPNKQLTRKELANYLVMGASVRQPSADSSEMFNDVKGTDAPYIEAVTASGAALKDVYYAQDGVMLPVAEGKFNPNGSVSRSELAYSLVQSLGLQQQALDLMDGTVTVDYKGERISIEDQGDIPSHLKGYVQLALDLNILNAYFSVTQGPYDLEPTITATFEPNRSVTRADYAVTISRFFTNYHY